VLRFDVAHLGRTLPQANPHSQALAEAMCRDVVARRRGRSGVTEEVRLWITRNVAYDPRADTAAAALAMSPRTLRRRLAEAGVGYQTLLDEVRQALAEEMLATGVLSVEDVAQRLGYAEASSFIHAFKRWRGTTPAQFRGPSAASGSAG
jgi:AraC-like DNA-binding protein